MVVTAKDTVNRTLAEKAGSPGTRDGVLRTLAEKGGAVAGGNKTQGSVIG